MRGWASCLVILSLASAALAQQQAPPVLSAAPAEPTKPGSVPPPEEPSVVSEPDESPAAGGEAQQATESGSEQETAGAPAGTAPSAGGEAAPGQAAAVETAPAEEPPGPNDFQLTAESQGREKGHIWGRGFADLKMGDLRIQADSLDIYDVETPQGTNQQLVAKGNVVLLRKDERVTGTNFVMNVDTGHGTLDDAAGWVEPGIFFTAKHVERVDPQTFKLRGARFTACCQPNPRWGFAAARATIKIGDHISATSVRFNVATPLIEKVPLIYLPYFIYPTKEEDRASGLLIPSFGLSTKRGFTVDVRLGFFWAMGRSADQTISVERRPGTSWRLGHDFRYAQDVPSAGDFRTLLFPPQPADATPIASLAPPNTKWEYDLHWNAVQVLPGGFSAKLYVDQTSPQNFAETSITRAFNSTRQALLTVLRPSPFGNLQIIAKSTTLFYGRTKTDRYLPQVSLTGVQRRLGKTGILYQYSIMTDRISTRVELKEGGTLDNQWNRFDFSPALSRPVVWPFLTLTPSVRARYTHYSHSYLVNEETGVVESGAGPVGDAVVRKYVEAQLDLQGPKFSRIFANEGGFYSDRFKHELYPEATWTYRKPNEDAARVPQLDAIDYLVRTHELRYGFTQRLLAKRSTRAGAKPQPYEFLTWRVYQTRYFRTASGYLDPNFNTLNPTGVPLGNTTVSPWRSDFNFRPVPEWTVNWTQQYDTRYKGTTSMSLGTTLRVPGLGFQFNWSRSAYPQLGTDGTTVTLVPAQNTVTTRLLSLSLFDNTLTLGGGLSYNFTTKLLMERTAQARLNVQCFGLMVNVTQRRYYTNQPPYTNYSFAIDLAHLGSIGMAPDMSGVAATAKR
jgi:hypothetical protein